MITFAAFNTKQYDTERRNGPRTEPATAEDPDGLPAGSPAPAAEIRNRHDFRDAPNPVPAQDPARCEPTATGRSDCTGQSVHHQPDQQPRKKGWVQRKQSPDDRRARQIFLTDEGVRMSEQTKPLLKEIYDRIGAATPPRQMQECRKQLGKLNAILDGI